MEGHDGKTACSEHAFGGSKTASSPRLMFTAMRRLEVRVAGWMAWPRPSVRSTIAASRRCA
jgi:hypothetical protein